MSPFIYIILSSFLSAITLAFHAIETFLWNVSNLCLSHGQTREVTTPLIFGTQTKSNEFTWQARRLCDLTKRLQRAPETSDEFEWDERSQTDDLKAECLRATADSRMEAWEEWLTGSIFSSNFQSAINQCTTEDGRESPWSYGRFYYSAVCTRWGFIPASTHTHTHI